MVQAAAPTVVYRQQQPAVVYEDQLEEQYIFEDDLDQMDYVDGPVVDEPLYYEEQEPLYQEVCHSCNLNKNSKLIMFISMLQLLSFPYEGLIMPTVSMLQLSLFPYEGLIILTVSVLWFSFYPYL